MAKTDKQLLLEARNPGKSIRDILVGALASHRGEAHLLEVAAGAWGSPGPPWAAGAGSTGSTSWNLQISRPLNNRLDFGIGHMGRVP